MAPTAAWHRKALEISTELTRSFHVMRGGPIAMAQPRKVIRVLREAGIRFMVMGTHGIAGYRSEPRATQDVDILVRRRDHKKAVAILREAYPRLRVVDSPVVTRFIDNRTDKVVIDLMRPTFRLYQLAFRNRVWVNEEYCIPNLEMALVAKFAAMTAKNRPASKRWVDAGDFTDIVENNLARLNLARLRRLGNSIRLDGGEKLLHLVSEIKAGRRIEF